MEKDNNPITDKMNLITNMIINHNKIKNRVWKKMTRLWLNILMKDLDTQMKILLNNNKSNNSKSIMKKLSKIKLINKISL